MSKKKQDNKGFEIALIVLIVIVVFGVGVTQMIIALLK